MIRLGNGAAQPNLLIGDLKRIEVPVPPQPVQRKIADILSAYDELIENNQRRIKLLEEIARSIYREWFVNFRFPGHEKVPFVDSPLGKVPKGWQVNKLGDIVGYNRRATKPGPHLNERDTSLSIACRQRALLCLKANQSKRRKAVSSCLRKGDILFGAMRPYFHKVVVSPFAGVTRTTCFVFKPLRPEWHAFATMTVFEETTVAYANAHSQGATIPYAVWDGSLAEMPLVLAKDALLRRFEKAIAPMLAPHFSTTFALNNLRRTRDLLPPTLLCRGR